MRGWDPALGVQDPFDDGWARLGEESPRYRQKGLGVPPPIGEVSPESAVDHLDEPAGAEVGRRGNRAPATHQDQRKEEGIVAAEHRELLSDGSEDGQGVDVDSTDSLLEPRNVFGRRELEESVLTK